MAKKKKQKQAKKNVQPAPKATLGKTPPNIHRRIGWFLFALAAVLYANTLYHGYAFDDSIVITDNSFTKNGFAGIPDLMTRDFFEGIYGDQGMELSGGRYRPLSLVTFAIEYQFFGRNPQLSHAINILLYALTAMFLYHVLILLLGGLRFGEVTALIASLIFVTHPTHTEVVANIKSRDEILALLLLLGAFYSLIKLAKAPKLIPKWLIIGGLSFFLAMLSKEHAFTFVLLFPLALHSFKILPASKRKQEWTAIAKVSMPFWAVGLAYLLLRTAMVGGVEAETNTDIMENPFYGATFVEQYATIGVILLRYLGLLIFPHPLSSDYSFNQIPWTDFSDPLALLGGGLYIGMAIYVLLRFLKRDVFAYSILLYFIPLSLTTNILFNIGAPMADRFLYIPSLGFALAAGYAVAEYAQLENLQALRKNSLILGILALVTVAFSAKTIDRNTDWKNNYTLFAADVEASPNSAKIHYYYGNSLLQKYMQNPSLNNPQQLPYLQKAEKEFLRSYEINPQFHHATYNLGLVYVQYQKGEEALKWLQKTLELQPRHILSHQLLGQVYGRFLGQPDKAIFHLKEAIEKGGAKTAENYQSLGIVYAMKQDVPNALNAFQQALTINPNHAKVHLNIGVLYMNNNQPQKAQQHFAKAKQLDPNIQVPQ